MLIYWAKYLIRNYKQLKANTSSGVCGVVQLFDYCGAWNCEKCLNEEKPFKSQKFGHFVSEDLGLDKNFKIFGMSGFQEISAPISMQSINQSD